MRLSQLSATPRYYYSRAGHADGARWLRSKKTVFFPSRFSLFFAFLSFLTTLPPPPPSAIRQKRKRARSYVCNRISSAFEGRVRTARQYVQITLQSWDREWRRPRRSIARGAREAAAQEKICSELWNRVRRASGVRRIAACATRPVVARRGVQSPRQAAPQHLQARATARWDTHGQKILFVEIAQRVPR